MGTERRRWVVDEEGNRVAVVIDLKTYRKMLSDIEELEAARAFDAAKGAGDEAVPFEEAVAEIEHNRR